MTSASLPRAASQRTNVSPRSPRFGSWLREPLLHFVVLGALLFAIDRAVVARTDDPRAIHVDAAVDSEARQLFSAARGRSPTAQELNALRRTWLDNEILYREGLALQVDRGDSAIRERVIFKALSMVEAGLKLPPIDDAKLRAWFERNRAKYDEPARYDFQEAVLPDTSEAAARALVDTLNKGVAGEVGAGLRVFKGRPYGNLVDSYGGGFARALADAPVAGEWRAYRSRDGWRVVRVEAAAPPKPASFETLRGVVLQDWTDETMSNQRTAAVRTLGQKYRVTYEAAP